MNPSASGWILKFLNLHSKHQLIDTFKDEKEFYIQLKETGFLYGISTKTLLKDTPSNLKITKEEFTKINLFHSLLFTFFTENKKANFKDAVKSILQFYIEFEKRKIGLLHLFSISKKPSNQLEQILSARLNETHIEIEKKSTTTLTYILLYIDVLVYKKYLAKNNTIDFINYADELERNTIHYSFLALKAKKDKNKNDTLLIELYYSSTDYFFEKNDPYITKYQYFEKIFILDICCLAIWDDFKIDISELEFLKELSHLLGFSKAEVPESLKKIKEFTQSNKTKIKLFEYSSPIKQIYKQSSATVKLIILRNKNRLLRELNESGELLLLLGESSYRELDKNEKTKVKTQLLDICKSVPSLAVFLVPGGSLLLPLLVKYIPSLLPSAFAENRIQTKK